MSEQNHIHKGLLRGSALLEHGILPNSRFADPVAVEQVENFKHTGNTVFYGLLNAEVKRDRDPKTGAPGKRYTEGGQAIGFNDDRHIVTTAGSRGWKGVASIIPNMLSYKGSIIATDLKAELSTITARHREDVLGQKVYVLDPFKRAKGRAAKRRCSFNPLSILKPESLTMVEDAGLIAESIIIPSGSDPHWDESAKIYLEAGIIHVATFPKYDGQRNLVTVYKLIMGASADLLEEMLKNPIEDCVVQEAAQNLLEKPPKERDSIISTTRRQIRFIGYKAMRSVLETSDFDLSELKTDKTTIYLCLPAMRMRTSSRWFRLMVNLALGDMEKTEVKPDIPVLFLLDEFAALDKMASLEAAAGQIAGFGCRLWVIIQDLTQLKSTYQDGWETFLANAGTLLFFANSDLTTLNWISERLGNTTVKSTSKSNVSYEQRKTTDATGESFSLQSHPLMTAEEASRFFGRDDELQRLLVIRAGHQPMILQKACYYRDPRYKGMWDNEDGTTPA